MRSKGICSIIFSLCCFGVAYGANALEICGELQQGELLLVKDAGIEKVSVLKNLDQKDYVANENGVSLIALHRDVPSIVQMKVFMQGGNQEVFNFDVAETKWDIQRIEGVQQHHVTPNAEHEKEIIREQNDVKRVLNTNNMKQYWQSGFVLPVDGRISGYFGNQRIFNGVPKSPHSGTDIAAPQGTSVKAAGDGVVILDGKDYFYTGNMVIIDHGQGLQTIYAHLQDSVVRRGDEVAKGQIIGHVGQTGRATGPHLHWGASLNNVRFNPHSLLDIHDKKCRQFNSQNGD